MEINWQQGHLSSIKCRELDKGPHTSLLATNFVLLVFIYINFRFHVKFLTVFSALMLREIP